MKILYVDNLVHVPHETVAVHAAITGEISLLKIFSCCSSL